MYEAPEVRDLGTVEELTEAGPKQNKVGNSPDIYSNVVPIIGSIVNP